MKIKPILWTYHKTKTREYPIKIRVTDTKNGKTNIEYFPIEISVKADEWDKKAGRVKLDKRTNAAEINLKIVQKTNAIERNFLIDGSIGTGNKKDFYWWFEERLKHTEAKHGRYNYKKLNTVLNKLKEYAPALSVDDVTNRFLREYETHLLNQGLHVNYVADQLIRIRIIVRVLIKDGVIPGHKNPFQDFKITTKKTDRKRLNEDQLEKLFTLKFKGHDSVKLSIKMYMYSFYNGGIRFGDLCRQRWDMIEGGRLRYTMHKSTVEKNIKLHDRIIKMLKTIPKKGPYIFDTGVDWNDEDESISRRNSFFRTKLKTACKWAGIPEVSFHTARHSLTDIAVRKKVDPIAMKNILGHARFSTTEQYMKSFYKDESDEAMDIIFNK